MELQPQTYEASNAAINEEIYRVSSKIKTHEKYIEHGYNMIDEYSYNVFVLNKGIFEQDLDNEYEMVSFLKKQLHADKERLCALEKERNKRTASIAKHALDDKLIQCCVDVILEYIIDR